MARNTLFQETLMGLGDQQWLGFNTALRNVPRGVKFGRIMDMTNPDSGYTFGQIKKAFADPNKRATLRKALIAQPTNMTDLQGLSAVRAITVENIDPIIKMVIGTTDQLKLLKLFRQRDITTIHDQYVREISTGQYAGRSMAVNTWWDELGFEQTRTSDVQWKRVIEQVKFLRITSRISHLAQNVETIQNPFQAADEAKALDAGKAMQLTMLFGNPARNPFEFPGLITQLRAAGLTYDMRDPATGRPVGLDEDNMGGALAELTNQVDPATSFGPQSMGSHLILPQVCKRWLDQILPTQSRIYQSDVARPQGVDMQSLLANAAGVTLGAPVAAFASNFAFDGRLNFVDLISQNFPNGNDPGMKALINQTYPLNPQYYQGPAAFVGGATLASVITAGPVAGSQWPTSGPTGPGQAVNGDIFYRVSSVNKDGENASIAAAVLACAAGAVTAGDAVTLTISVTAPEATKHTGFRIFRSDLWAAGDPLENDLDCRWIADCASSYVSSGGTDLTGITYFVDLNDCLPGANFAIMISNQPGAQALDFTQLLPFVRCEMPFGLSGDFAYPYVYFWYAYLRMAIPQSHILLTNVAMPPGTRGNFTYGA